MREALLIWAALLIFAVVHSALASHRAKTAAQRLLGAHTAQAVYRLIFNAIALVSIAPALFLVVTLPDRELYRLPPPLDVFALIVQFGALLALGYSLWQMDWAFFLGLRQLSGPPPDTSLDSTSAARLVTTGLHRYVRHPLYTASLVLLALVSPMTLNRLALLTGVALYFYVGSIFEERKLVREFGDAYRAYQRRVPRLWPRLWPRLQPRR